MLILFCKEYNCIFITFSRCWSKTITNWVKKINNITENVTHNSLGNKKDICFNYMNLDELNNIKDKYYIYFMVRNPYERFLLNIKAHNNHNDKSFLETVRYIKDNNIKLDTFYNDKTNILLKGKNTHILYFDNFKNDLENICVKHNIPYKPEGYKEYDSNEIENSEFKNKQIYDIKLSLFNYKNMLNYKYFYNQEIINYIYNIFKNDFIYFNFNKNIEDLKPDL